MNNKEQTILVNAFVTFILKGHESDFRAKGIVFNSYEQAETYATENKKIYQGYFNIYVNHDGEEIKVYCSYEEEKRARQQEKQEKKNSKKFDTKLIEKEFIKIGINQHKCCDLFPDYEKFYLRWLEPDEIEIIRQSKLTSKFFYKMEECGYKSYICYIRDDFRKTKNGERPISLRDIQD